MRLKQSAHRRQNKLQVIRNWIAFFTLCAAIVIGYFQIQINSKLYQAQYSPSPEIEFLKDEVRVRNRGNADLFLLGVKYPGEGSFSPPEEFRLGPQKVPSGGSVSFSKRWSGWLEYAETEARKSRAPSVIWKFEHQFRDHDGDIFIHQSLCRFEKEGEDLKIYTDNFVQFRGY